jgi:hypothetical protein
MLQILRVYKLIIQLPKIGTVFAYWDDGANLLAGKNHHLVKGGDFFLAKLLTLLS